MTNKCAECGIEFPHLHDHHIWGRRRRETISLCPNCHTIHHAGLLIVDNKASRKAMKEIHRLEKKRYVGHSEKLRILDKHGYNAMFDDAYRFFKSIGKIK